MPKPNTTDIDRHIGERVKKLRQQKAISAASLAEALESTQQQVSRYENGQNKLSAAQLYRISKCLGMPPSWFYEGLGDESAPALVASPEVAQTKAAHERLEAMGELWKHLSEPQQGALLHLAEVFLER